MESTLAELGRWRPWAALGLLAALLFWETAAPYFTFFPWRDRLRHGAKNLLLGALNALVTGLGFAGLWFLAAAWAEREQFGLLRAFPSPGWARLAAAVLLLDLWTYWWHRLNHRLPFLWRLHRVHHSDPWMDVTTANRFHLGEIILSSVLRIPLILLLGLQAIELAAYELLMFAVVQFHHANVALPERCDRALRMFIVTPFMHKVHHSRHRPETDSNYSSLFSFWDRVFRSFRLSPDPHRLVLGLDEFRDPGSQTLWGILRTPWRKAAAGRPGSSRD